jgi:uncharacterized membrane protein (UPF0127 family)
MASKKRTSISRLGCLIVLAVMLGLAALTWGLSLLFDTQSWNTAQIRIHEEAFDVYVAENFVQRAQGLSGQTLDTFEVDGMYFVFGEKEQRRFWMNDMEFAIDIIWIEDDVVVKVEEDVLPPSALDGAVQSMYSSPYEVNAVLEFPAGAVRALDIAPGTVIEFLP